MDTVGALDKWQQQSMEVQFKDVPKWSEEYQRNNKNSKVKNIRCFPYCFDQHREKSFCGQPVVVNVFRAINDAPLCAWAAFGLVDEPQRIVVGDIWKKKDLIALEYSRQEITNPLYSGVCTVVRAQNGLEETMFEFNKKNYGWNYGWKAHTHTRKRKHCLYVYVFQSCSDTEVCCVSVTPSPAFSIRSLFARRRKKRPQAHRVPDAPLMQENFPSSNVNIAAHGLASDLNDDVLNVLFKAQLDEYKQPGDARNNNNSRSNLGDTAELKEFDLTGGKRSREARGRAIGKQNMLGTLQVLKQAYPLNASQYDYQWCAPEVEIPAEVLPYFGKEPLNFWTTSKTNKRLWRIAVVLTVMESHWLHGQHPALNASKVELKSEFSANTDFNNDLTGLLHLLFDEEERRQETDKQSENQTMRLARLERIEGAIHELSSELTQTSLLLRLDESISALGTGSLMSQRREAFVSVILRFAAKFLKDRNITLSEFCHAFDYNLSADLIALSLQRLRSIHLYLSTFSSLHKPESGGVIEEDNLSEVEEPDTHLYGEDLMLAGVWRPDKEACRLMNYIRLHYLRISWVMRKLLAVMDSMVHSEVIDGSRIRFSIRAPFARTGGFVFNLDGQIHRYVDNLHLPLSRPIIQSYRAAVDYEAGTLTVEFFYVPDSKTKLRRILHRPLPSSPDRMEVDISFSRMDEAGQWQILYQGRGCAKKVSN